MEDQEVNFINKVLIEKQYEAEAKISEGSYGQIYRVSNRKTKKISAFKALQKSKLQKQQKLHEAVIQTIVLKKTNHPGIIKMSEVINEKNYLGIVMQYCPYGDIFNLMKKINQNLALAKKKKNIMVYYLAQILQALDYLHDLGVVHRDLKPENIVLGSDLKIRIIDFGTAKIFNKTLLSEDENQQIQKSRITYIEEPRKSLVGSAHYLSPEALKLEYSEKSDIWAFGVIIYKFYHNSLPFDGPSNFEIFTKIKNNQIVLDPKISPEIQELIVTCMKKDPKQRPSAKMLKLCTLFKSIDFKNIFSTEPPIFKDQIKQKQEVIEQSSQYLFEFNLQKKMFFGNFKPRTLTISKYENKLMMAYRYPDTKKIKNEFELNMNSYAQKCLQSDEFEVVTEDKKYAFRVAKGVAVEQVTQKINTVIKAYFNLD